MPPAKDVEFTVHGVTYIRSGSCNRCGDCCRPKNCQHFIDGSPSTCNIQSDRIKHNFACSVCDKSDSGYWYKESAISGVGRLVRHLICKDFPNHPFLGVIMDLQANCSYTFTPKTTEDAIKHQKLVDAWQ